MKKKQFTILALVLVVIVVVAALILNSNRPYKPTSFVVDGDNWSATVVDGSSIRLELNNNSKEWSIISEPETFVSDFHTITENISEFHIIALNDGEGEMVFAPIELWEKREKELDLLYTLLMREQSRLAGAKTYTVEEMASLTDEVLHAD